jgi:branched-chain amino acid transport system permease protein
MNGKGAAVKSRILALCTRPVRYTLAIVIVVVLACTLLYVLLPDGQRDKASNAVVQGIMLGGVYSLLALGVVVVYKSSKVFNLSFGGLILFLTYLMWWLMSSAGLPLWLSLILLAAGSVAVGLIINRFIMTPLIGDSGLNTFIVTMVLGFSVLYGLVMLIFGGTAEVMPRIFPSGSMTIGAITISYTWLSAFLIATLMFLAFAAYFRFTRTGLQMRAVSENHLISQSVGINVRRIFAVSWVIGTLSAAISGLLLGSMFAVDGSLGGFALSRGFPVLLLGGLESLPGAFIAAFIIGITETLAGNYIDPYITGFREGLPYVLMVVILMLRPNGLFGLREIRRM